MKNVEGDEHGWLVGRFPPTVRRPFGRLPSGALLMPLGDTAITFDPIGGQGANNANRMAKFAANAVVARGENPFDEAWMTAVNEAWWAFHARWAYTFNNMLLEPLQAPAAMALAECGRNRVFADQKFFSNFPRPHNFFPWIEDLEAAKLLIDQGRRPALGPGGAQSERTGCSRGHYSRTSPSPPTALPFCSSVSPSSSSYDGQGDDSGERLEG